MAATPIGVNPLRAAQGASRKRLVRLCAWCDVPLDPYAIPTARFCGSTCRSADSRARRDGRHHKIAYVILLTNPRDPDLHVVGACTASARHYAISKIERHVELPAGEVLAVPLRAFG